MTTLTWILLAAVVGGLVITLVAAVLWRRVDAESRRLVKRISRLSFRGKLALAGAMARDQRIPSRVRIIPPALVLYLAMPIDIIPDFIPILGQLDDVIIVVIGVGMLLRFTPRYVLEEHIARLEAAAA